MVLHKKRRLRECALFAGAGGGILGGILCGWHPVVACEIEEYPRAILLQRQLDGILPQFPIWDDVRTFDGTPWRGKVDIVTGSFPCQDISAAGKGKGLAGERSGLWGEMARIIGEIQPEYAFVENSPMLTTRGLDVVLGDLASLGYDAKWAVLGASDAGAPHRRQRIWIAAHSRLLRCHTRGAQESLQRTGVHGAVDVAHTSVRRCASTGEGEDQRAGGTTIERTSKIAAQGVANANGIHGGTRGARGSVASREGEQNKFKSQKKRWCQRERGRMRRGAQATGRVCKVARVFGQRLRMESKALVGH